MIWPSGTIRAVRLRIGYEAIRNFFKCFQRFIMQLRIYNETLLTSEMYSLVTEIVAEILFVMVLVAMQIHERKSSKSKLLSCQTE
jgi:hypothetical protein